MLKGILEALVFVSDEPISVARLTEIVGKDESQVKKALDELVDEYKKGSRGFRLRKVAGGYRFYTNRSYASYVEKYVLSEEFRRLSQASLETLAVVAYKQPIAKADVRLIRGVNVESVMNGLIVKGLIEEVGKEDSPGHPVLYGTTKRFLESFGLNTLDELPDLADFEPDEETKRKIRRKLAAE